MKTANIHSRKALFRAMKSGAAVAVALSLSVTQLHAGNDQTSPQSTSTPPTAAEQAQQPVTPPAPGQVTQPADGRQLIDEVNEVATQTSKPETDVEAVDAEEFVETASAKSMASIDTARLALEEGSPAVRAYANKIIEDHTKTHNELTAIAGQVNLEVADDATLMDKAREFMLSVRDDENFDAAYVDNQIATHEDSIELYQRATQSDVPQISAFARSKLPALQEHLRMATALKNQVSSL